MKEQDAFDIIIQAGQSNSQGCGLGAVEREFKPNGDIWYMNQDFSLTQAKEQESPNGKVNQFALSFCEEYIAGGRLKKSRKLLILRSAVGGTGFLDKRWGLKDDLYLTMMEMIKRALAMNASNRLVALLWHQGETDAILQSTYEQYYDNIGKLVGSVRDTFSAPDLPFAAGDFVREWKSANEEICEPVIRALRDFCGRGGNARLAETADLHSNNEDTGNGDVIHFSRNALYLLGVRYYKVLQDFF